jgi:hypothetical protein
MNRGEPLDAPSVRDQRGEHTIEVTMAGYVLTSNAVIQCIHGGTVTITPRTGRMTIDGGAVLCDGDLVGATIVGCTLAPTTNTKPCTSIVATMPGSSTPKLVVSTRPAYIASMLQGVTDSVPPGTLSVVSPGQTRVVA